MEYILQLCAQLGYLKDIGIGVCLSVSIFIAYGGRKRAYAALSCYRRPQCDTYKDLNSAPMRLGPLRFPIVDRVQYIHISVGEWGNCAGKGNVGVGVFPRWGAAEHW